MVNEVNNKPETGRDSMTQTHTQTTGRSAPAAACYTCGGWTSFGGCAQFSSSEVPVLGRAGCECQGKGLRHSYVNPQFAHTVKS